MKKIFFCIILATSCIGLVADAAVSKHQTNYSRLERNMGGTGTEGGGDSLSTRIRKIRKFFNEGVRDRLLNIATIFKTFEAQGEMSLQLKLLVEKGLLEDIEKVEYKLEPECYDDKGILRSASTKRIDLGSKPNQTRPPICVNYNKLAIENANWSEILGLMFHEHARHFNVEDTIDGYHPIADYITKIHEDGANFIGASLREDTPPYKILSKTTAFKTSKSKKSRSLCHKFRRSKNVGQF